MFALMAAYLLYGWRVNVGYMLTNFVYFAFGLLFVIRVSGQLLGENL